VLDAFVQHVAGSPEPLAFMRALAAGVGPQAEGP
jgi:hypothetical protein